MPKKWTVLFWNSHIERFTNLIFAHDFLKKHWPSWFSKKQAKKLLWCFCGFTLWQRATIRQNLGPARCWSHTMVWNGSVFRVKSVEKARHGRRQVDQSKTQKFCKVALQKDFYVQCIINPACNFLDDAPLKHLHQKKCATMRLCLRNGWPWMTLQTL